MMLSLGATPMRRREFIAAVGGAVAWPLVARAQRAAMPVIGFLNSRAADDAAPLINAFRDGLKDAGFVEGSNVAIEYRWADGHYDRLRTMAADLVSRQVAVIAATGGIPVALVAKVATTTIPIVFGVGADPVELGLVTSLNHPGGNITGVSILNNEVAPKLVQLLHDALPNAVTVGLLINPTNPYAEKLSYAVQESVESVFAALVQLRAEALLVEGDPFIDSHAEEIVALATRHQVPTICPFPEYVVSGGLMSYGPNLPDAYRVVGLYTGRILKGEKPADLPVQQSTKIELIINLKTAKTLGLAIPLPLLGRADEVIE
jgi:putative ABC transport system substrate-binding protein